jgi:hypothetical protein
VAAGLILAAGWFLRPRDIPESPPPVPSETELQELTRRAQRRSLESTTAYFSDLATDVRPSLGYIPSVGASGIVWDESHVVSGPMPILDDATALTVRTTSGERTVEAASSRRLPLSVLEVSAGALARRARRAASLPDAGDWVVAVWQTDQVPAFAAANFRQMTMTTCGIAPAREFVASIPLTRAMTGGGIFNMERELLGVILPCGDHMAAIEPSSIDEMLKRVTTVQERALARYGILVSSFSPDERRYFSGTDGLLVREVWMGTRGDAAGLQPGDVVVALNGRAVAGIDDLQPLTTHSAGTPELEVRRGAKTQTVTLAATVTPGMSSKRDSGIGLVIESPRPTYRIDAVLPEGRAARAGVKAGDILRRINHVEPRTRAQVDRAMKNATSTPILLEIERDRRRVAIIVPEGPAR